MAINGSASSPYSNTLPVTTPAPAGTPSTLTAVADGYVRDGSYSTNNYGAVLEVEAKLEGIGWTREAFVRYNAASVSGTVAQAKLRIHARMTARRTLTWS